KQLVAGTVATDMLAGPSELIVFADSSADPATVAADLLAQAEHDPDAVPVLVTVDATLLERVERELACRVATCRRPASRARRWRTGARSSCRAWTTPSRRATPSLPSTSNSSCGMQTR